ncbi:MAG TPA: type III PLP-dependent enzyme [Pseudonocardiaceae bacterium]|nr:type III PLP-dependent enzyme [Pseudonocardiaceae bacterium]
MTERVRDYLARHRPPTPCLVIDLDMVARRFGELRDAWPGARICYAVKANPAPEILRLLAGLGAEFDVAGPAEITACLAEGASPAALSYGNTIKKATDIADAHARGVRRFTTDSHEDLRAIAEHAPGADVFCRILVLPSSSSATPFGRKFGCAPAMAREILRAAPRLGLRAAGVAFHVGSQQTDPAAWTEGIALAAGISAELGLTEVNLGGGFPVAYRTGVPGPAQFAATIQDALRRHFPGRPTVLLEPGRAIVAEAGVLRSEVVLVSRKSELDPHRWVYLDVGRYGGLAETEGEAITYRLVTAHDDGPHGPVVLAGPTCDGDDVIYQHSDYQLPLALRAGDQVDFLAAGAYTASYSSIAFNGFPPLATYCLSSIGEEVRS